jgi:hypothetical protein
MTQYQDKVSAYKHVIEELTKCTEEDSNLSAAVLIFQEGSGEDGDGGRMRIYGLNMDELELSVALIEAVDKLRADIVNRYVNRTVN